MLKGVKKNNLKINSSYNLERLLTAISFENKIIYG